MTFVQFLKIFVGILGMAFAVIFLFALSTRKGEEKAREENANDGKI